MDNKSQKTSVQAQRRRPGSPTPSGERERAEAPVRRREGGSGGNRPSGQLFPTGGKLPRSPLGIGILVLVVVCILTIYLFTGGDEPASEPESAAELGAPTLPALTLPAPTLPAVVKPSPTRRPTQPPAQTGGVDSWLVLLYQDADDKVLEQDIFVDLNEAERVGSAPNLKIVAQIDRFQTGYAGDDDWTGARRYFVRQDDDLNRVGSDLVMDLGEVNMASGDTLVDFVTWAIEKYPADKVALILSDHGMGWPGGWSDPTARR